MTFRELWATGRFDEAIASSGDAELVAMAKERLGLWREHGIPVAMRLSRRGDEVELILGGAGLRFVDGALFGDEPHRFVCDPRSQDVEPFLAALVRAAAIDLPPSPHRSPWPVSCSITLWSGKDVHPTARLIRIHIGISCELLVYVFTDGPPGATLCADSHTDLATTVRMLATKLRGDADPAALAPPMFDMFDAWGKAYPRIVGDGLCQMRDGVLVHSADAGPNVTPTGLDVALIERAYRTSEGNLFAPQLIAHRPSGELCIVDLHARPRAIDLPIRLDDGVDTIHWDPHAPLVAIWVDRETLVFDTNSGALRARLPGSAQLWEPEGLVMQYQPSCHPTDLRWWRRDGRVEPATWVAFRARNGIPILSLAWRDVTEPAVPATSRSRWFGASGFVERRGDQNLEAATDTTTGTSRFMFSDPRFELVDVSPSGRFAVAREHDNSWAGYVVARRRTSGAAS